MFLSRRIPLLCVSLLACWCVCAPAFGDEEDSSAERAIRKLSADFATAFERGDTGKLAELWTDDGDFIGDNGVLQHARAQIERMPGASGGSAKTMTMTVDSLRLISKDIALADGVVVLHSADAPVAKGRYSAVWVQRDGRWLLDALRESTASAADHHAHLVELQWMVGSWAADTSNLHVETNVHWSEDKNFLLRDFQVTGAADHSGTQRIGWDAASGQFRSWAFGDDGSYSVGVWQPVAGGWEVTSEGVAADGKPTASKARYLHVDDDAIVWESHSASSGGHALPDVKIRLQLQPENEE